MANLWTRLFSGGEPREVHPRRLPALSTSAWLALERMFHAAARNNDNERAARMRIKQILSIYLQCDDVGKSKFFALLSDKFGPDEIAVRAAINRYLGAADRLSRSRAEADLTLELESPRLRILRQFNLLPDGVSALVCLRADLLRLDADHHLAELEWDLLRLLTTWFDVGFLELQRIGWNSPAALLEKLIRYEAVHEIKSWTDMRNRLDSDRRCYAFFHPRMPEEPLIFIEVALVQQISRSIQALLDESQPTLDPAHATTAVFYSISSTQPGLKGVSLGEFLIKRVVEQLVVEYPRLQTFVTLSPVPGFGRWLEKRLTDPASPSHVPSDLHRDLAEQGAPPNMASIRSALDQDIAEKRKLPRGFGKWLQRQCAAYLLEAKSDQHPLDPVARFHFSNGASLAQINWLADTSAHGRRQSLGLMVNYLYQIEDIEKNHDAYAREGSLAAAPSVRSMLAGTNPSRPRQAARGSSQSKDIPASATGPRTHGP